MNLLTEARKSIKRYAEVYNFGVQKRCNYVTKHHKNTSSRFVFTAKALENNEISWNSGIPLNTWKLNDENNKHIQRTHENRVKI